MYLLSSEFEDYLLNVKLRLIKLKVVQKKSKINKIFKKSVFSVKIAISHFGAKRHIFPTSCTDDIDFFHCFSLKETLGCLTQRKGTV